MARVLLHVAGVLIGLLLVSFQAGAQDNPTCTPEYSGTFKDHTMCLTDSPNVEESGVSAEDRALILTTINQYRGSVSPSASDLPSLGWSDKLAAVAQKWAKQCQSAHDKERSIPSWGVFIGQSFGSGFRSWEEVIGAWHNQKEAFTYGENMENRYSDMAHYSQMVMNTTTVVGCGYAKCFNLKYFVCNYGAGINYQMRSFPYTKGAACSACPEHCKNNLCDCGGKICLHGGTLNVATCTCDCLEAWQGSDCSELKCPEKAKPFCGSGSYTFQNCFVAPFVHNICPKMCHMCP